MIAGQDVLRPLTSLRFAAALLVFAYHSDATTAVASAYALGQIGVGFFFVLSGFILTYTYHREFAQPLTGARVRAFYIARVARIYPLHLVAMLIAVAVLTRFGGTVWSNSTIVMRELAIAAQLVLIQSWIPDERIYLGVNSPAWSISVEMFFYSVFPFAAASLLRSFGRSTPSKVLAAAGIPWLIAVSAAVIPHPIEVWTSYVFPPLRFIDFVVGMLVGIAFLRSVPQIRGGTRASLLEVGAIAAVIAVVLLSPRFPEALRYSLLLMPFWAFLIFVFARQSGAISRLLARRVFVRLGEISFAFYLVHWSVIHAVGNTLVPHRPVISTVAAFVITLGLSFALFHLVEQPMRIRLRTLFSRRNVARRVALPEAIR